MIRKHSAKVLTITTEVGVKHHFVFIGGKLYFNGSSKTGIRTKSKDGFWDDKAVKNILENRASYRLSEVAKAYKGCKAQVYIREWTTNQAVYGVPF